MHKLIHNHVFILPYNRKAGSKRLLMMDLYELGQAAVLHERTEVQVSLLNSPVGVGTHEHLQPY